MRFYCLGFIILLLALSFPIRAGDDFCGIRNSAFSANEVITYRVYYTLGVFIAAGEATFQVMILASTLAWVLLAKSTS